MIDLIDNIFRSLLVEKVAKHYNPGSTSTEDGNKYSNKFVYTIHFIKIL